MAKAFSLQRIQLAFACADILFDYFPFLASGMPIMLDVAKAIVLSLLCEVAGCQLYKMHPIFLVLG